MPNLRVKDCVPKHEVCGHATTTSHKKNRFFSKSFLVSHATPYSLLPLLLPIDLKQRKRSKYISAKLRQPTMQASFMLERIVTIHSKYLSIVYFQNKRIENQIYSRNNLTNFIPRIYFHFTLRLLFYCDLRTHVCVFWFINFYYDIMTNCVAV